jgi:hypothetical protein
MIITINRDDGGKDKEDHDMTVFLNTHLEKNKVFVSSYKVHFIHHLLHIGAD